MRTYRDSAGTLGEREKLITSEKQVSGLRGAQSAQERKTVSSRSPRGGRPGPLHTALWIPDPPASSPMAGPCSSSAGKCLHD